MSEQTNTQESGDKMQSLVEQVVSDGRHNYEDFDKHVSAAADDGRLGELFVTEVMPQLGEDAAHLTYALSLNEDLCDEIEAMTPEQALAYLRTNKAAILDKLNVGKMTQQRYESVVADRRTRKAAGEGPEATEQDKYEAWRRRQGARF